jgi:hypothetical protein
MKRLIYTPAIGEEIPPEAKFYTLPIAGDVVDVLVADDFTTAGTLHHDSSTGLILSEPYFHHFDGWQV